MSKPSKPGSGTPASGSSPLVASSSADLKRRRFLFSLTAGGAGVAAATVAALPAVAAVVPAPPDAVPESSGYRETEHVRDYYRTAKH